MNEDESGDSSPRSRKKRLRRSHRSIEGESPISMLPRFDHHENDSTGNKDDDEYNEENTNTTTISDSSQVLEGDPFETEELVTSDAATSTALEEPSINTTTNETETDHSRYIVLEKGYPRCCAGILCGKKGWPLKGNHKCAACNKPFCGYTCCSTNSRAAFQERNEGICKKCGTNDDVEDSKDAASDKDDNEEKDVGNGDDGDGNHRTYTTFLKSQFY